MFRVDPQEQLDPAFGGSGRDVLTLGPSGWGSFHAVAAAVGGRTIAAGERTDTDVALVAPFLDDGTLDTAFAGGVVEFDTNDARVTWWDDTAMHAADTDRLPSMAIERRYVMQRFPFLIGYVEGEQGEPFHVIAIAQGNREPGYWRGR